MSETLKISIITACFNSEATIGDAIATLKRQSWNHIEHIIIDGSSKDNTVEIARESLSASDVLVSEKDNGIYDALNKGIAHASGDIIGFLHSDDIYASDDALKWVAECFEDPSVDAVYGDLEYVDAANTNKIVRYWKSSNFSLKKLNRGWMPPHPTFFMRRNLYEELGNFDLTYQISSDYDSMLRYLGGGKVKAAYLPRVLMKMRLGGVSNRSLSSVIRKSREDYHVMKGNGLNPWLALGYKNLSKIPQFFKRKT